MKKYPHTDLVILAGGQARRMNGVNKLLQTFDDQIQLLKIYNTFKDQVGKIWINSHRDSGLYQQIIPDIQCYADDQAGFLGPLMGMKSAWAHVQADYVLFIPCDVTYIPNKVIQTLHETLLQDQHAMMSYVNINGDALYPFCLMKRTSCTVLQQHLQEKQLSLNKCRKDLHAQVAYFRKHRLFFHSINSLDELQQYKQLNYLT
ncbi:MULTISPECIES: NTP transferase domain-containing protein [unclassified Acinetobacter]|uniref:NTP transferase domain-containing protein n=1 Tax=unclassified Acinetobacter TaxID=196816 RepID=UPI001909C321|nr:MULTISPECIES: NTP transferase domain-containing protein [unclassified Acinetobacter]MBK0063317.1 NTP transferase domain-containing protein [Acinetobacter sp. S55]MBK0066771.1 NTP transferase domain-containing protein [Acinetobacter sp. S54]